MKRLILVVLCLLCGCGGGSSGTSSTGGFTERTFTGRLTDRNGSPLANARVEIEISGDSTTTDEDGAFTLLASVPIGKNNVLVTAQDGSRYAVVALVAEDEETVILRNIYSEVAIEHFGRWQISARVTGEGCQGRYFSGAAVPSDPAEAEAQQEQIDRFAAAYGYTGPGLGQYDDITDGTKCAIQIKILKDQVPVPNLSYTAYANTCGVTESGQVNPDPFQLLTNGASDADGAIKVPFTSISKGVCSYEVRISGYGGLKLGGFVQVITSYGGKIS